MDPGSLRRSVRGTAVGNFMEWYDFGVYGYIALIVARVFFPGDSASAGSLVATFGTLAAAFTVRPLGGWVFGRLGDRVGRKPVLVATISVMTAATAATGLLPGYHSIGGWAPVLLIATRMVQGFSAGGEYAGSMIYVGEHAPDRKRATMTAFLPLSSQGGYVAAGAVVTLLQAWLPEDAMLAWGWRLPLLLSVPFGVVAIALRLRLEESGAFRDQGDPAQPRPKTGLCGRVRGFVAMWRDFRRPLLVCVGLVLAYNVTDYLLTGYLPTYLTAVAGIDRTAALTMVVATLLVTMSAVIFVAKLADRTGVKPLLAVGCGALLVGSVPAFLLIGSGAGVAVTFPGVLLIGVMLLCFDATLPATLPSLFPTAVRYEALAVGFNLSVSVFGGTAPLVAELLVSATGHPLMPAVLLMSAGVVGALALWFTPEVAGRRLPGAGPAVESEAEARRLAAGGPH